MSDRRIVDDLQLVACASNAEEGVAKAFDFPLSGLSNSTMTAIEIIDKDQSRWKHSNPEDVCLSKEEAREAQKDEQSLIVPCRPSTMCPQEIPVEHQNRQSGCDIRVVESSEEEEGRERGNVEGAMLHQPWTSYVTLALAVDDNSNQQNEV